MLAVLHRQTAEQGPIARQLITLLTWLGLGLGLGLGSVSGFGLGFGVRLGVRVLSLTLRAFEPSSLTLSLTLDPSKPNSKPNLEECGAHREALIATLERLGIGVKVRGQGQG